MIEYKWTLTQIASLFFWAIVFCYMGWAASPWYVHISLTLLLGAFIQYSSQWYYNEFLAGRFK